MQLDRTRIAIRERPLGERMDLSLHVLRAELRPLLWTLALGAVPCALWNQWLLGWLPARAGDFAYVDDPYGSMLRYAMCMILLVAIEAPLATVFITAYMGRTLFFMQPNLRDVVGDVVRMFPQLAWNQLVLRGVLLAWWLVMNIDRASAFSESEVWLLLLACGLVFWRCMRPFINEIVLLERNPWRSRRSSSLTTRRRSALLHSAGDLVPQGVVAIGATLFLVASLYGTGMFLVGTFLNVWSPGRWLFELFQPLALWLTALYMTVLRFLNYLDLRIRQEGWELELRLRAEGTRLAAQP